MVEVSVSVAEAVVLLAVVGSAAEVLVSASVVTFSVASVVIEAVAVGFVGSLMTDDEVSVFPQPASSIQQLSRAAAARFEIFISISFQFLYIVLYSAL